MIAEKRTQEMPPSSAYHHPHHYRCVQIAAILAVAVAAAGAATAIVLTAVPSGVDRCVRRHARRTLDDDLGCCCCCCCCCCMEECCRRGGAFAGHQSLFSAPDAKCHSQCLNCFGAGRDGGTGTAQRPPPSRKPDDQKRPICCEGSKNNANNNDNDDNDDYADCCCCSESNNNNNNTLPAKEEKRVNNGRRGRTRVAAGSASRVRSKINILPAVAFPENNRLQQLLQDQIRRFQFDGSPKPAVTPEVQNADGIDPLRVAESGAIPPQRNVGTAKNEVFDVSRPATGSNNRPSSDDDIAYVADQRCPYGVREQGDGGFYEDVSGQQCDGCEFGGIAATADDDRTDRRLADGSGPNASVVCGEGGVAPSVNAERGILPLTSSTTPAAQLLRPPPDPQPILSHISSAEVNLLTTTTLSPWITPLLLENLTTILISTASSGRIHVSATPPQLPEQPGASDARPDNNTTTSSASFSTNGETNQRRTVAFEDESQYAGNQRSEAAEIGFRFPAGYGTVANEGRDDASSQMTDGAVKTVHSRTSSSTDAIATFRFNNNNNNNNSDNNNNVSSTAAPTTEESTIDSVSTLNHLTAMTTSTATPVNGTATPRYSNGLGRKAATSSLPLGVPRPPGSADKPPPGGSAAVVVNAVIEAKSSLLPPRMTADASSGTFAFTHGPIGRLENAVYLGDNNEFLEGSGLRQATDKLLTYGAYGRGANTARLEPPTTTIGSAPTSGTAETTTPRNSEDGRRSAASAEASRIVTETRPPSERTDSPADAASLYAPAGTAPGSSSDSAEPNAVHFRDIGLTTTPAITTRIVEIAPLTSALADVAQEPVVEAVSIASAVFPTTTTAKTTLTDIDILEKFLIDTSQSSSADAVGLTSATSTTLTDSETPTTSGEPTTPTTTEPRRSRGSVAAATVQSATTVAAVPQALQHRVLVARKADAPPHHDAFVAADERQATTIGRGVTVVHDDTEATSDGRAERSGCRLTTTPLLWLSAFLPLLLTR